MFGKLKHYRRIATRYEKKAIVTWECCRFPRHLYGWNETSTEPRYFH